MKISQCAKNLLKFFLIFVIAFNLIGYVLSLIRNGAIKEGFKGRKSLLLLHMEGCPHCVKLMPEWDKFTQMNNTSIITKAVEKDDDRALVKRYGVEGFPTILLLDSNGKKLDTYSGARNAQGLLDYCQQNN
jgi:thiol-disulfide isomerase/thioredoxin